jgi:acyl-CoA synthetase (AMP-forming)/AMP-acid ligase II
LGFLHSEELYICGRSKDLIIVRGSNHYPQDIERTAEKNDPALRPGCSAAFSIVHEAGHTEAVVYVAEVSTFPLSLK